MNWDTTVGLTIVAGSLSWLFVACLCRAAAKPRPRLGDES